MITAVILAAGRGIRMGSRGELSPKGLIRLGDVPLVRASVINLQKAGVQKIRIVTGHLDDMYHTEFSTVPNDGNTDIEIVHNPAFAKTGSLNSLLTGLRGIQGHVLLVESDILYERRALPPLLEGHTRILVSGPTHATDEVYVWGTQVSCESESDSNQLKGLSKNIRTYPDVPKGEFTGLTSISAHNIETLSALAQTLQARDKSADYETALVALAGETRFDCHLIADLKWAEVDDEIMLRRAKSKVWPKLVEQNDYARSHEISPVVY